MIPYSFCAIRCQRRPGKWLGQFMAPGLGTRYVRDAGGAAVAFSTDREAAAAASAALIRELNREARPVKGRAFSVVRKGTRAHAALLAEVFGRGAASGPIAGA